MLPCKPDKRVIYIDRPQLAAEGIDEVPPPVAVVRFSCRRPPGIKQRFHANEAAVLVKLETTFPCHREAVAALPCVHVVELRPPAMRSDLSWGNNPVDRSESSQ